MILDKEKKIAYLQFPAKADDVAKAKDLGYEIIDILFAPDDLKKTASGDEKRGPGRPPGQDGGAKG